MSLCIRVGQVNKHVHVPKILNFHTTLSHSTLSTLNILPHNEPQNGLKYDNPEGV